MHFLKKVGWKDEPSEETPLDSGNLKALENNVEECIEANIKDVTLSRVDLIAEESTAKGATIDIGASYKVGADSLMVFHEGSLLKKATNNKDEGHYYEVGNANSVSTQIILTEDWGLSTGEILTFIVKGVFESDTE